MNCLLKPLFHYFTIALYFMAAQGCFMEKDSIVCTSGCIIFDGFVFDPNNGILLQDAEVSIEHVDWLNVFFADVTKIGKIKTNDSGHFTFSFPGEKYADGHGYFVVSCKKDGYFEGELPFQNIDSTSFDLPITANLNLLPKARLNIHLDVDTVKYKDLSSNIAFSNVQIISTYSTLTDTTYIYDVAGDEFTKITYSYKRYGVANHRKDSIFIKGSEVGLFEIKLE